MDKSPFERMFECNGLVTRVDTRRAVWYNRAGAPTGVLELCLFTNGSILDLILPGGVLELRLFTNGA